MYVIFAGIYISKISSASPSSAPRTIPVQPSTLGRTATPSATTIEASE